MSRDKSNQAGHTVRRTPWPKGDNAPLVTPLQPSVVYRAESPDALDAMYEGRVPGYAYAREGHPNADVLARHIDRMEGAKDGLITGSGMAAITAALLGCVTAGDHVLAGNQLYGRSLRMLLDVLPPLGIDVTLADPTDCVTFGKSIRETTKLVLVEVVSNPTLRISDIRGIAQVAKAANALLMVDNTFTTPRAFRPFEYGADIVVHSVTKLLAGHSDATLGYVAAQDVDLRRRIYDTAVTLGLTPSPFDCWLAERGMQTFPLRYDQAETNAAAIAEALAETDGVLQVLYPMRADHPDHSRAADLLGRRGGTMLSFRIAGSRAAANALVRAAPDIAFAPTLGDIGTTLSHPASSSHRGLTEEGRAALGITEGFFRLSVGVEDPELIVAELRSAISAALKATS